MTTPTAPAAPTAPATLATSLAATPRPRPDFGGQRLRLGALPIPGHHLCWVNDTVGNVAQFQSYGYQFVTEAEQGLAPTKREDASARGVDLGTNVRRLVGSNQDGSGMYAYLMKVEQSLFDEGMRSIEDRNRLVQESIGRLIKEGQVPGEQGFYAKSGNKFGASTKP